MPNSAAAISGFLDWLSSEECVPWLKQQARLVLLRVHDLHLPRRLWPYGDPSAMPRDELDDNSGEIAHEFWLYINDLLRKRGAAIPYEVLPSEEKGLHVTGAYLRNAFVNHLRGLARRKNMSTHRHLYRRLREILSDSPGFFYCAQKERAYYSMVEDAPLMVRSVLQGGPGYGEWGSPYALVSLQQLMQFRRRHLCALAELFWREASQRLQGVHYLPVWELTAYLSEHYGIFDVTEHLVQEVCQEAESSSLPRMFPDSDGLEVLAEQLVSSWSPVRRKVFYLALDNDGMTYQWIAQQAGLSGASHSKYHLDRACKEMADFCETWPGLTPPSQDREFWTRFLLITAWVCKKSLKERHQ